MNPAEDQNDILRRNPFLNSHSKPDWEQGPDSFEQARIRGPDKIRFIFAIGYAKLQRYSLGFLGRIKYKFVSIVNDWQRHKAETT
jgi:hypothetical protein